MRSRGIAAGAAAGILIAVLAGCGQGAGRSSSTATKASHGGAAGPVAGVQSGDKAAPATGLTPGPTTRARVTPQPALILTGEMTIRATGHDTVNGIADRAVALVQGEQGQPAGDERRQVGRQTEADLILKVPPAKFVSTLDGLSKLGKEISRSAHQQDVTDQVVDVDSRVSAQRASVERVRKLLASANNLGEVVQIEGELAQREADLESLQARQRALGGQTSMATITLHVRTPDGAVSAPTKPVHGFTAGLKAGWAAFTASVTVLLTVVGAALPFLAVAAIPLFAALALRRRRQLPIAPRDPVEPATAP